MIDAAGYFDWMLQIPGVPDKVYTEEAPKDFIVNHSIVGSWAAAAGRLMSTERLANGQYTSYAAASVHWINPKAPIDGFDAIQQYPVTASCWASGTRFANVRGVAGELEGGPPGNTREPMTHHQVLVQLRAARDLRQFFGWPELRIGTTLREHNEFQSTACPSGRYERFYAALAAGEETDMTPAEVEAIVRKVLADEAVDYDALVRYDSRLSTAVLARNAEVRDGLRAFMDGAVQLLAAAERAADPNWDFDGPSDAG